MSEKITGIMGAMPEEINGVVALLVNRQEVIVGGRTYFTGNINGIKTVVVFSRWGKVAAATTVSTLILTFNITQLLFTGVAGAISHQLKIGDIVIAKCLVQHDMDARPLMPQFEIPLLGKTYFDCDADLLTIAKNAVNDLLENKHLHATIDSAALEVFDITVPKLVVGNIASGDQFISGSSSKNNILQQLPAVVCVQMEGAALAQVCFEYDIPFVIIRTISDTADEQSHIDFPLFIKTISNRYAVEIIKNIYSQY